MRAVVTVRGPQAEVLRRSLAPEAGREIPRSRVTVRNEGDVAEIVVEAEDVAALDVQAAVNA